MAATQRLFRREAPTGTLRALRQADPGLQDIEYRLLAARGQSGALLAPRDAFSARPIDLDRGAARLGAAIRTGEQIVVVADYDCDGATSCAVMIAGLRALGAKIDYVVPDRMIHGYGISPSVVDLARDAHPDARVLVTVDNGILGHAGITHAQHLGMDVVVTDHHLPGQDLPDACAVIDPSRSDCPSGLGELAGVGVALWLVLATRKQLADVTGQSPNMGLLLSYLAIGTTADLVPLRLINRSLLDLGLRHLRAGHAPVGVKALIEECGINPAYLTTTDIGFALAPRINAAGRLENMRQGIDLLLTQDPSEARRLAQSLTEVNNQRKSMQKEAVAQAGVDFDALPQTDVGRFSIVQANPDWHPGIIGLVASRLKDAHHLPTFVFSLADDKAKGSGRSIPGFHLKDALEDIARAHPGLIAQFGGHAMAAGLTLSGIGALDPFKQAFEAVASTRVSDEMREQVLMSDGEPPDLNFDQMLRLLSHPWGQGFEPPAFDTEAKILRVDPLGKEGKHWRIQAKPAGQKTPIGAVLFNQPAPTAGSDAHLYLRPGINTWAGNSTLQWIGEVITPEPEEQPVERERLPF